MNREYEVCRIAVEWQNNSFGEFDKTIMRAIQHADSSNITKLFRVYPYHVEAFLRYHNLHDNPLGVAFRDNPRWYKETEEAFWHDVDIKEEMAVNGYWDEEE